MKTRPSYFYKQSAVIPFRLEHDKIKFLMISNRKQSRWIFPKGIIEPNLTPQESAAQEAFEEAGIRGRVYPELAAEYQYKKWGGICSVQVYWMKIEKLQSNWPEADFRHRIWVGSDEAQQLVREKKMKMILQNIPSRIINLKPIQQKNQ